jgi:hypothetical protein
LQVISLNPPLGKKEDFKPYNMPYIGILVYLP